MQVKIVITSYSIHYTKLYDELAEFHLRVNPGCRKYFTVISPDFDPDPVATAKKKAAEAAAKKAEAEARKAAEKAAADAKKTAAKTAAKATEKKPAASSEPSKE